MNVTPTPQLGIAIGSVVVALAIAWLSTGGIPSYPIPQTDLNEPVQAADTMIIPANATIDPVYAEGNGRRLLNPFNLRPTVQRREASIPPPPPPRLALPPMPVLPLGGGR